MSNDKIMLKTEPRQITGKKVATLRRDGIVPGTVYGHGLDPVNVQMEAREAQKVYSSAGKHHPVYLTIDGKPRIAMIKHADLDPVKKGLRHLSLHAVKQNEKVEAEVPVVLIGEGESAAEKAGLVVLQNIESIEVSAVPSSLPDELGVSIMKLAEHGDRVTVADIKLPEGVEFTYPEETELTELVIASVYEPSALQAANDALAGEAEDEAEVEAEHGEDTDQDSQAEETRPGGKLQDEPKQSNVDANK